MIAVESLKAALDASPLAILGIMIRERIAYCRQGVNSHGGDQELLALIASTDGLWYGYLYRASPDQLKESGADKPWVATLVNSRTEMDGATAEAALQSVRYHLFERNDYEPCFTQEPGDILAFCATFEEGCKALEKIIRCFDPDLRDFGPGGTRPPGQCNIYCFTDRWPSGEYIPPELI
ncbi:MAG: hypothetical protein A2514_14415 [Gammaproteobacteria bacterium RIFOXYD12_FULL_61_37]|nr:MAG: hypothetical protein A2514_14415 [Gammaproteobacteria bacterium RIFOXYD12_FULL_61_37]